jgi:hypothetical protein
MISNPHLLEPTAGAAWAEGFTKGFMAISSPQPSDNVSQQDVDAFNEGVSVGSDAAENGLETNVSCVSAREGENPVETETLTFEGIDIVKSIGHSLSKGKLGFALSSIFVAHTIPPDQVLPGLGQEAIDTLAAYGLSSVELFCGGGVDPASEDCEIQLTILFSNESQARAAAQAMGRPQWFVVSWRTDQSNSFRVVESS